jgi:hypothetical protein
MAADRAALWCGRGAAAMGVGDRNLRQHVLVKSLAIPSIKRTSGGTNPSPAATN